MGSQSHQWGILGWFAQRLSRKTKETPGRTCDIQEVVDCCSPRGIPFADHVLRELADDPLSRVWNDDLEKYVVNPTVFDFTPDVSVKWKEHLAEHGWTLDELSKSNPKRPFILEASVEVLRALKPVDKQIHVVYTPQTADVPHCAHSSVLVMGMGIGDNKMEKEVRKLIREALVTAFELKLGAFPSEAPKGS